MSQQNQYARTYRNNITNTRLFNLTGVNSEGTLGFLSVEVSGNGVKVSVYTGLSDDKQRERKTITARFKGQAINSFLTVLNLMVDMANHHDDGKKMTYRTEVIGGYKNKEGKFVQAPMAELLVRRNEEGIYQMALINRTHGRVWFDLTVSKRDLVIYDVNSNEPASEAFISRQYMLNWVRNINQTVLNVLTQEYADEETKDERKGRSGGGYNGGSNSYNKPQQQQQQKQTQQELPSDYDDDSMV